MTAKDFLEIKEYLKSVLKFDIREDLHGNSYLVLLLDNEIIDKVSLDFEYDED